MILQVIPDALAQKQGDLQKNIYIYLKEFIFNHLGELKRTNLGRFEMIDNDMKVGKRWRD